MNIGTWLKAHFDSYRNRTKWDFLWRITLEGIVVPVCAVIILKLLFDLPPRTGFKNHGMTLFAEAVIVAPVIETLLLQSLPVMIARSCGVGFWGQVLASLLPFAGVHFLAGTATGICAGILGGFYTAFTYVHWRQASFRSALWMTSGSHAVHNLLPMAIMLLRAK